MDKQNSAKKLRHVQLPGTFVGKTILGFLALLAFVITACYRESMISVVANFTVEVADNNFAVPARDLYVNINLYFRELLTDTTNSINPKKCLKGYAMSVARYLF
jgi:hypothetical protein